MKMIPRWKINSCEIASSHQVANSPRVGNFKSSNVTNNNGLSSILKVANLGKVGNLLIACNFQKLLVILGCYVFISCSSGKSNAAKENSQTNKASALAIPPCIQKMIDSAKANPGGQSITEVTRFIYNGAKVYLVAAPCCDQFNPLYDSACNLLFSPSGGITGKGDRSNPDFFTVAKQDSVIWKAGK